MSAADLIRLFQHQAWHAQAACVGMPTKWFFPPQGQNIDPRARDACSGCPVVAECRKAGEDEMYGTWAGVTPKERRLERLGA